MNNTSTTIVLIILVVLAAMWSSGRMQRILSIVFGSDTNGSASANTK